SQQITGTTGQREDGAKISQLNGPLFFASIPSPRGLSAPAEDPASVLVQLAGTRVMARARLAATDRRAGCRTRGNKKLEPRHLSRDCRALLDKAGDLVRVDLKEDPHYRMAIDELA